MHEQARVDRRRWFDAKKDCPDQALGYRVQKATNRRGNKAQVTVYAIKDDIKPFILPQLSIFNSVVYHNRPKPFLSGQVAGQAPDNARVTQHLSGRLQ